MHRRIFRTLVFLLLAAVRLSAFSQETVISRGLPGPVIDSLIKCGYIISDNYSADSIDLTTIQAIKFLQKKLRMQYWKDPADPLRVAIGQVVFEASHKPYDSAEVFLKKYPFDSLDVSWDKFYIWEPLKLKIPFVSYPKYIIPADSLVNKDTLNVGGNADSLMLAGNRIPEPQTGPPAVKGLKDTTILVVIDTLHEVTLGSRDFPFAFYDYPYQSDSIAAAVKLLMNFIEARDSSLIFFTGGGMTVTPVWLNSRSGMLQRHWLKTNLYDSATVWIGAQSRNTIAMYLENGIGFVRPSKQQMNVDARVDVQQIDRSKLQNVRKIAIKPQYWKYRSEASFALNQAHMDNWVKGGESSISSTLDITGYADYNNKQYKVTSNNFARLKYGLIWTDENGIRKNLDLLETNSKVNHKAFGKFDFSAILLFKTQLAKGWTYANDDSRTLVSKFMNPGILTVGFGLDYKPNKTTSINFSPFSYKGTFVTDTTGTKGVDAIDQTKYGIPADRKSKNEPGASFMITNEYKPLKTITVTNRLQLFTNYINNPENIDIDWEMILTANLNWFTDVRFNTHLIFDDDTKSPINDEPGAKKTARVQFKEILGLSFIFRF